MGIQKPNMQALWADQGAIIAPTDTKVRLGWVAEVPPNQWENWVQNRQDRALAYLMQKGIPEWDSETEYIANKSFVQKDGKIYKCIATNTGNDPATRSTFWDSGIGLGLGTAAYAYLTTSNTDTTAGRVLKVGDYGLGTQSTLPDGTGFSTLPVGGNYQISGNHPDAPSAGGGSLHVGGSSSLKTYLYIQNNTRKVYVKSGTSHWAELWSGLNFNPSEKVDKTTAVLAGTGLGGGGDLSQDRTLSVVYGTTANTSVQGNDARVVNSLQKENNLSDLNNSGVARTNLGLGNGATLNVGTTENTIAAGDDPRITGALQKSANLNDLMDVSAARGNLGLGSAASRNIVGSLRDASREGKVLVQGYMGIGGDSVGIESHIDEAFVGNGFWFDDGTLQYSPGAGTIITARQNENYGVQIHLENATGGLRVRYKNLNSYSDWIEFLNKRNFPPIGFCYTQFPGTPSPSDMFGGTWVLMFNTDGVFFRTEGQGASSFGSGVQGDAMRRLQGMLQVKAAGNFEPTGVFSRETAGGGSDESGAPGPQRIGFDNQRVTPTASENRPRNVTVRVWRRTA